MRAAPCSFFCNTLQHTAKHCNQLQHTATHCNTPRNSWQAISGLRSGGRVRQHARVCVREQTILCAPARSSFCNTPQCNTPRSSWQAISRIRSREKERERARARVCVRVCVCARAREKKMLRVKTILCAPERSFASNAVQHNATHLEDLGGRCRGSVQER